VAAADLARRYPNVALDTSGDCYTLGLIEHLVEQAGADKVLFGSDLTWIDPRTQLGMILDAPLHDETKEKILYRNAHRIFPFASLSRKSFS
jgi:predicted TIM-barrel fold metal-dependent hydrolase